MTSGKSLPDDLPVLTIASASEWEQWLEDNGERASGCWLRLAKKGSPTATVSYAEAVDGALCYGWIDGQKRSLDAHFSLQRFTPRRAKSLWSRINREKVGRLMEAGRMRSAGLRAVEAAKADGRWEAAYDSPSTASVPPDLAEAFEQSSRAREAFNALNGANRYAILIRIQTAIKPETRARRIRQFVEMLERGEKLHP